MLDLDSKKCETTSESVNSFGENNHELVAWVYAVPNSGSSAGVLRINNGIHNLIARVVIERSSTNKRIYFESRSPNPAMLAC
jgi:hypothetical protein